MTKATQWVRNLLPVFLMVGCITWGGLAAIAAVWAFDDALPFKVLRYTATPTYPGGTMLVIADVERDLSRNCDAVYSRRFVDAAGAQHPVESDTTMGHSAIFAMDKRNPNKLIFPVPIPESAAPGMGLVVTPIQYVCNPWHWRRPITASIEMTGEVLRP